MNFLASTTSFLPSSFALPGEVDEDVFLSANKKQQYNLIFLQN